MIAPKTLPLPNRSMNRPLSTLFLTISFASLCVVAAGSVQPALFDREVVDADARWVLHLDLERLRETEVGRHLEAAQRGYSHGTGDAVAIEYRKALDLIHNLTAYGVDFKRGSDTPGILVARTSPEFSSIVEALLIQQQMADRSISVQIVQDKPFALYLIGDDTFLAIHSPDMIVVSKSRGQIDAARAVLDGTRAHLSGSDKRFGNGIARTGFFFFGAADGFSASEQLPAQAAVLRMARSGRISAGVESDDLFVELELEAQDELSADRLLKVTQGMLAMFALTSSEKSEWYEFVERTTAASEGNRVRLNILLPTQKSIEMIDKKAGINHTPDKKE
jgi:hypothetical protein